MRISVALLLAIVALPVAGLVWLSLQGEWAAWPHLLLHVLPTSFWDTTVLLVSVGFVSALLGAGTAWLTTLCRFPMRSFFAWALVLPLAVPTYIAAYTHVEFFDFSGPLQNAVRSLGGYQSARDYWFPDIRSLPGATLIFSAVLYPYVYLTCRLVYSMQGASILDASRTLGAGPLRQFYSVAFPMARPALAAGVALVLMETLNDIGAVEILGVRTLSYAVFETWLNRDNLAGAAQIALVTLVLVVLLVLLERQARQSRFYAKDTRDKPPSLLSLSPVQQAFAALACLLPLLLGLGLPLYILATYSWVRLEIIDWATLIDVAANTVTLAGWSALCATMIAYGLLQYGRVSQVRLIGPVSRIATLGYAVPGTVLAIGLLIPLAGFDNWLDSHLRTVGLSWGLMLSGSLIILIYACTVRFMAIAFNTIESGFARVSHNIDMAARALGKSPTQLALQVHRPIMTKALLTAFVLVFVDSAKELSATLLLRPIGFETLATHVYAQASQSALEDGAMAALLIVVIGFIPIIVLNRLSAKT